MVAGSLRRVAVIGSGISGLVVGREMHRAGYQVTVFEKSRGPGGRLSSRRLDDGTAIDIGAAAFTIRSPVFRDWLEPAIRENVIAPLSCDSPEQWCGVPRMSALTRFLSRGLDLQAGYRILSVDWQPGRGWQLEDQAGAQHGPYGRLVITAPPAQTSALLSKVDGRPDIEMPAMAPRLVYSMGFSEPVHFPEGEAPTAPLESVWHDSAKPGRKHQLDWWTLHATEGFTENHLDSDPGLVRDRLAAAFTEQAGINCFPEADHIHLWRYAFPRKSVEGQSCWLGENGLGLCGDWWAGQGVEDAFHSAFSLAQRLRALQ